LILLTAASLSAAEPPAVDAEHLIFLADHGLAVIRLEISVDGKSHRETCGTFVDLLCHDADRDGDGFLSSDEYDAGVTGHPVLQERTAQIMRPNSAPPRPDFGPAGKLTVSAVSAFLLRTVWPPLRLEFAASQMRRISGAGELLDRPLDDTKLFERLDTDGNHKLTSRELERAGAVLAKLDFDEDETISLDELRMQPTANAMPASTNRPSRRSDAHLSLLAPERIDAQFVRKIFSLYDGETKNSAKDLRLDRHEIALPEDLFAHADADEDGYWDFDELWRYLEHPTPVVEIAVRVTTNPRSTTAAFSSRDDRIGRLIEQKETGLTMEIHKTRMQFVMPGGASSPEAGFESGFRSQFASLDSDANEYLEWKEFQPGANDDSPPNALFQSIDVNRDGKIYFNEFLAYQRQAQEVRARSLVLSSDNLERTLFGPLDANGDGRLSQRELARLKGFLAEWDADRDGKLIESEIPQQYRLTLQREIDRLAGSVGPMSDRPVVGPLWFQRMDRNRDGEVSPREFLGTAEQFQKIDVNGDGAIDADEAQAVK
jgi:hypothetical protein